MLDRTTAAAFPVCFEDQRPLTVSFLDDLPISCRSAPVHVGCPFSLLVLTTRTKQRGKFPLSACRSTQCTFHIRNLNCFFCHIKHTNMIFQIYFLPIFYLSLFMKLNFQLIDLHSTFKMGNVRPELSSPHTEIPLRISGIGVTAHKT